MQRCRKSFRTRCVPLLVAASLLLAGLAPAWAAPATDADVNRLLAASRAQSMLNAILPQMEAMQRQQFEQLTAGKPLSAEQKADVDRIQSRTNEIVRESLAWEQMRPLYIDVYKQTFTSEEVKAMAKFYESPAGKSLQDKTPLLMQNLMLAIQQKMIPMLEALQAELKTVAEEEAKAAPAKKK